MCQVVLLQRGNKGSLVVPFHGGEQKREPIGRSRALKETIKKANLKPCSKGLKQIIKLFWPAREKERALLQKDLEASTKKNLGPHL